MVINGIEDLSLSRCVPETASSPLARCVNDAVLKFLQFQISTNITAVTITFVFVVFSSEEGSVLTVVQLLWIIVDTSAVLAPATDPASIPLLNKKPDTRGTKLSPADMVKMTLGQLISITRTTETCLSRLGFNTFVPAQIFDSANYRKLDDKSNTFEGVLKMIRNGHVSLRNAGSTCRTRCLAGCDTRKRRSTDL